MVVIMGYSPDRCRKQNRNDNSENDCKNDCASQMTLVVTSLLSFSDIVVADALWGRSVDRLITTFTLILHGHKLICFMSTHDDGQLPSGVSSYTCKATEINRLCPQYL